MAKTSKTTTKASPKAESKSAKKWKWTDTEDIAFKLIDMFPQTDPLRVRFTDLHRYVTQMTEFGDDPKKSNEKILEAIQMRWYEERQDMEDELGPIDSADEELDEDDYRDDELAGEEDIGLDSTDDDDDEDEDEFGDGFQEEGEEDER